MSRAVIPPEFDELLAWAGSLDRAQVEAVLAATPATPSPERAAALARQSELGVPASVASAFTSRGRPHLRRLADAGCFSDPADQLAFWDSVRRGAFAIVQGDDLDAADTAIILAPLRAAGYEPPARVTT